MSRDLEEDEVTVVGKFERALRFVREKNNIVAKRNILHDVYSEVKALLDLDTNIEDEYYKI